jgi:hypothetical protein
MNFNPLAQFIGQNVSLLAQKMENWDNIACKVHKYCYFLISHLPFYFPHFIPSVHERGW